MATLYDIDQAILACIDLETGELIDPERLEALQMERSQKFHYHDNEYDKEHHFHYLEYHQVHHLHGAWCNQGCGHIRI